MYQILYIDKMDILALERKNLFQSFLNFYLQEYLFRLFLCTVFSLYSAQMFLSYRKMAIPETGSCHFHYLTKFPFHSPFMPVLPLISQQVFLLFYQYLLLLSQQSYLQIFQSYKSYFLDSLPSALTYHVGIREFLSADL